MTPHEREAVTLLRSVDTIRERCARILAAGLAGQLAHFRIDLAALPTCIERVVAVTRRDYPSGVIPVHGRFRHFEVGGIDRLGELRSRLEHLRRDERARVSLEIVTLSVLLDAGAGPTWRFQEAESGGVFTRSEGLAVASFRAYLAGAFSSDPSQPLQANAEGLRAFDAKRLASTFQVDARNPMDGLEGRAALIQKLGAVVAADPGRFGRPARLGHFLDTLQAKTQDHKLPARTLLSELLWALAGIWPGRVIVGGENLGDVWHHPQAGGQGLSAGLVPFHKLSQWLSYSLVEPLLEGGIEVIGLDALTGLPEYRNGGLLLDTGVLVPTSATLLDAALLPSHEAVIEWRALTLALLDKVADGVRKALGKSTAELPMGRILQGGTWMAGREIAKELRTDGGPPLRIQSDGTVF